MVSVDCSRSRSLKLLISTYFNHSFLNFYVIIIDILHEIKYNFMWNVKSIGRGNMNVIESLKAIAASNNNIIETKTAVENGISRATLSNLCKQGKICRIIKGQYVLTDEIHDELFLISKRSNRLIFSHETALFFHGISDRTPFEHSVTVPSNYTPTPLIKNECKIYYVKPELFELGKIELKTPHGNMVTTYDMERTICDLVRSRNRIDTETFLNALKQYSTNTKKDLNKLNYYAKQFRVLNILRRYMEVLL